MLNRPRAELVHNVKMPQDMHHLLIHLGAAWVSTNLLNDRKGQKAIVIPEWKLMLKTEFKIYVNFQFHFSTTW